MALLLKGMQYFCPWYWQQGGEREKDVKDDIYCSVQIALGKVWPQIGTLLTNTKMYLRDNWGKTKLIFWSIWFFKKSSDCTWAVSNFWHIFFFLKSFSLKRFMHNFFANILPVVIRHLTKELSIVQKTNKYYISVFIRIYCIKVFWSFISKSYFEVIFCWSWVFNLSALMSFIANLNAARLQIKLLCKTSRLLFSETFLIA